MEKEFVPYEEALALKELGFDEDCEYFGYYYIYNDKPSLETQSSYDFGTHQNTVSAPLYQQAFRWFREEHSLWEEVKVEDNVMLGTQKYYWLIFGGYKSAQGTNWIRAIADDNAVYTTYEEAQLACLRELIKIVQDG